MNRTPIIRLFRRLVRDAKAATLSARSAKASEEELSSSIPSSKDARWADFDVSWKHLKTLKAIFETAGMNDEQQLRFVSESTGRDSSALSPTPHHVV